MRLLLFLTLLFPALLQADECPPAGESQAELANCVETGQWHFSLAVGAGHRSNPLNGGRNFPYLLLPDLSYYGQHWFFDNGTLGYSWTLQPAIQLSLVSRLNEEKGYFNRFHLSNLLNRQMLNSAGLIGPAQKYSDSGELSLADVAKRPTAVDAGIQLNWFATLGQVQANWWHDVSGHYEGQHASLSASQGWQTTAGNWQLTAALAWKSRQLIQTYYGVEQPLESIYFDQPGASWQPELKLSWNYPLTTDWSVLAFYRYRWLDDNFTRSPLVAENSVRSWFFGMSYRFF